jgi:hypothetical protein
MQRCEINFGFCNPKALNLAGITARNRNEVHDEIKRRPK